MSDITMTKFSIVYFLMISLVQINVTKSDTEVIYSIEIYCAIKIVSTEVGVYQIVTSSPALHVSTRSSSSTTHIERGIVPIDRR